LDGLLGNRLNLLLHGPDRRDERELLGDRLPVLPAAAPGRAEIVHLTATGLRRYATRARGPPSLSRPRRSGAWPGGEDTFTRPARCLRPEPPAIGPGTDPHSFSCSASPTSAPPVIPDAAIRRVDTARRSCS
jgi:hypothetical protein